MTAHRGGEHRKWEQIKKSQRATADDHEQFFKELDDVRYPVDFIISVLQCTVTYTLFRAQPETGGFDCVVRYFGKGVIR